MTDGQPQMSQRKMTLMGVAVFGGASVVAVVVGLATSSFLAGAISFGLGGVALICIAVAYGAVEAAHMARRQR